MADGYQYLQQGTDRNYFFRHTQKTSLETSLFQNKPLQPSQFASEPPPPTVSIRLSAEELGLSGHALVQAAQQLQQLGGMFSQNHQQGAHNARLNGAPANQGRMAPMLYNYAQSASAHQQQQQQQHQAHAAAQQHHQGLQNAADHGGGVLGHHSSFSSVLPGNAGPFTPGNLQNGGHLGAAQVAAAAATAAAARSAAIHQQAAQVAAAQVGHTIGGQQQQQGQSSLSQQHGQGVGQQVVQQQQQQFTEHWQEQMRMHKESAQANALMVEQHQPHYFARLKASENKGLPQGGQGGGGLANNNEADGHRQGHRVRPWMVDKSAGRQDWQNVDLSGHGLKSLSPVLFKYKFLNELYIASNKLTYLPPSIGQLRQLTLLDASHNQLSDLPAELGMCTLLRQLLLFDNHIRTLPYELGSLHLLEVLGIEGNPMDNDLKQEVMDRGTKSLITWLREQAPPPPEPSPRKIVTVQEDVSPSLERVRVFSWNTLCDKYSTEAIYGYTPSGALSWQYRKVKILEQIIESNADILCLQEIATDAFKDFYSPELAMHDYRGVHFPKTRAKTMHEKDANTVDGCAVYYKQSKFVMLDKHFFDFASIAINRPDMKNQHDIFNRVMPKDQVGVICFFESRGTGARLIIANTHLCWEPTLADVKVIQTAILMEQVAKLADKYTRFPPCKDKKLIVAPTSPDDDEDGATRRPPPPVLEPAPSQEYRSITEIPLLVCGDFNSMSDSSVYELLSTGHVDGRHQELTGYSYGNFTRDGIDHPFSLRSAYAPLNGTPDELPFTNYTPDFANVIDYIWYSTNTLEVVDLLGPPDAEHLARVPGFPNYHFPADHIQLVADLIIKARKGDKKASSGGSGGASAAAGTVADGADYHGGGGPSSRN